MKKIMLILFVMSIFLVGCTAQNNGTIGTTTTDNSGSTQNTGTNTQTETNNNILSKYYGEILAGENAPYIVFNSGDYQEALEDDKIIMLYFYADWSPTCKTDQKAIIDGFNKMSNPNIIGFRVNYDDDFTDTVEAGLATTFDVREPRTKVILKNGVVVQKTTATWNENDYVRQIAQHLD